MCVHVCVREKEVCVCVHVPTHVCMLAQKHTHVRACGDQILMSGVFFIFWDRIFH